MLSGAGGAGGLVVPAVQVVPVGPVRPVVGYGGCGVGNQWAVAGAGVRVAADQQASTKATC